MNENIVIHILMQEKTSQKFFVDKNVVPALVLYLIESGLYISSNLRALEDAMRRRFLFVVQTLALLLSFVVSLSTRRYNFQCSVESVREKERIATKPHDADQPLSTRFISATSSIESDSETGRSRR